MTEEQLAEIEARANAATAGPWQVWNGPEYTGGGRDLCIGAGEEWVVNMDHRYGPDYADRCAHDSAGTCPSPPDCPICRFNEDVTAEQAATAAFIAAARTDVPELLAEVRRLRAERRKP